MGISAGIFSLIMTVVSIAYQYQQSRAAQKRFLKQQAEAKNRAEEAKGFQITVDYAAGPVAIQYGRGKLGGTRVHHATANTVNLIPPASGGASIGTMSGLVHSYYSYFNSKGKEQKLIGGNGLLVFQQVLGHGGISRILTVDVNDLPFDHPDLKSSFYANVYLNGGVADPTMTGVDANRADAVFTGLAYATVVCRLDRDDPQYSGVPQVTFYCEGLKVPSVERAGDLYTLGSKSYSNLSPRVLLDYLTNAEYGKGLAASEINLKSFYAATKLAEKVVLQDREKNGRFWTSNSSQRNVSRFEANIALSSEATHRDNIEKILETMDMSELLWVEGQYKLVLKYPTEYATSLVYDQDDVVQTLNEGTISLYRSLVASNNTAPGSSLWAEDVAAVVTDDDLVLGGSFTEMWPAAKDRYNSFTVRFRNEAKNFEEDTVTWPARDSSVWNAFVAEDGGQTLEGDNYEEGITDQWHAMARAEQRCRFSRISAESKFILTRKWVGLEPGDLIFLSSEAYRVPKRLLRVTEISLKEDGTVAVTAFRYDARVLAWNANDSEVVPLVNPVSSLIKQASDLTFETSNNTSSTVGVLSWQPAVDDRVTKYRVLATTRLPQFIDGETVWMYLGETSNTFFPVDAIPSGPYTFAVAAMTNSGRVATQWSSVTANRWPLLSAGAGALFDGVGIAVSQTLYTRASGVPSVPSGGTFDFGTLVWSEHPAGWSSVIPSGGAQLYSSTAVLNSQTGNGEWSLPLMLPDSYTYLSADKAVLPVLRNEEGINVNYSNASVTIRAFVNNIDVTLNESTLLTIVDTQNCEVLAGTGTQKGVFLVTSLVGLSGAFTIRGQMSGADLYRTISVQALQTGYQVDLTPPPSPAGALVTTGLTNIFIELTGLPGYTEGHGHLQTEVFTGAPGSTAEDAVLTHTFDGTLSAFPVDLNTQHRVWLAYRSKDGVLSSKAGPYEANTSLITSDHIADASIVNAKIGNVIQAHNYVPGVNGWKIDKSGAAEFSNITVHDGEGNVVMSSGTGVAWNAVTGPDKPQSGATRNVHRGAWGFPVVYLEGESVEKGGSAWVCQLGHTSSASVKPPTLPQTANAYWSLLAAGAQAESITRATYLALLSDAPVNTGSISPNTIKVGLFSRSSEVNPSVVRGRFRVYLSGSSTPVYTSLIDEEDAEVALPGGTTEIKVEAFLAGGFISKSDELTIPVFTTDVTANVWFDNLYHKVIANNDGDVLSYTASGGNVRVFSSGAELSFTTGALGLGQFSVSPATVISGAMTNPGVAFNSSGKCRIGDHYGLTTSSALLSYGVNVRYVNGTAASFTFVQTVEKLQLGPQGLSVSSPPVMVLSNDKIFIPSEADGSLPNVAVGQVVVSIFEGAISSYSGWTVDFTLENISGTLVDGVFTMTGFTADHGSVTFTATKAGYAPLVRTCVFEKAKGGAPYLNLSADSTVFTYQDGMAVPATQSITIAASGDTTDAVWETSPSVILSGAGDTRELSLPEHRSIAISVTKGGVTNSLTLYSIEQRTDEVTTPTGATFGQNIYGQITPLNAATYIANGAIQNAQIGNIIQSSNFVAGSAGWHLDKAGNMEINSAVFRGTIDVKSAPTGARLEVKNNVIKVFDANGTLRVKLGDLDA